MDLVDLVSRYIQSPPAQLAQYSGRIHIRDKRIVSQNPHVNEDGTTSSIIWDTATADMPVAMVTTVGAEKYIYFSSLLPITA